MKQITIIPKGIRARNNAESGIVGECTAVMNMREREDSLQAVGIWAELGDVSVGEKVLLVDCRQEVRNVFTCKGTAVYLHGKFVEGEYLTLHEEVCKAEVEILWAESVGDFVVIGTDVGCMYLYFNGTEYVEVKKDDIVPQISFKALSAGVESATVPGVDFESEYSRWSSLREKDRLTLQKSVNDAYSSLLNNTKQKGAYIQPVSVRYAVKLWDDSYAWISAPVVVGLGVQVASMVSAQVNASLSGYDDGMMSASAYNIGLNVIKTPSEHLLPLIKSVEILVSEEMTPFVKGNMVCRCEKSQTSSVYYLTYGLQKREQKVAIAELINPDKWQVVERVTDVGKLNELSRVLRSGLYAENLHRKEVKSITQTINHDVVANTALSLNGRLYSAGHYRLIRNVWQSVQYWGGNVSGVPCEVIVTARIRTLNGEAVKVSRESYDYTPTNLNAMIAYPDSRATELTIKILSNGNITEWNGTLAGNDAQGIAYFIGTDLVENKLVAGYSFYEPAEQNTRESALTEFIVSRTGNPWVMEQRRQIGQGEVLKLVPATRTIYSGVFGHYPIYAFASDGIYAVAYKEQGDYKDAQLISHRKLKENRAVAVSDECAYFIASDNTLCRLSGKDVAILARIENVSQMVWVERYSELLLRHDDNVVSIYMPRGRIYDRSEGLRYVYSDFGHALGVDISGKLRNLNAEISCDVNVYAETHPMAIKGSEIMVPLRLCVNISGVFNPMGNVEIYGSDGVMCDWRKLEEIVIEGVCCHNLMSRIYARPCRLVKLRLSGNVNSGTTFCNAVLTYG